MAIRIRNIKGVTVALCAAATSAEPGDVYLDDAAHHALTVKFDADWRSEGMPTAWGEPQDRVLNRKAIKTLLVSFIQRHNMCTSQTSRKKSLERALDLFGLLTGPHPF